MNLFPSPLLEQTSYHRACCGLRQAVQALPRKLSMIGAFLLSTRLLSSVHCAKVEKVEGFVEGAGRSFSCPAPSASFLPATMLSILPHLECAHAAKARQKAGSMHWRLGVGKTRAATLAVVQIPKYCCVAWAPPLRNAVVSTSHQ
ncbi:hypothetical protein ANAPC5_01347 [Anaplasma phagocytophilum]|nr:hypothetical protein ANAPC5_01347 [Anaplasma phagocytophilum]